MYLDHDRPAGTFVLHRGVAGDGNPRARFRRVGFVPEIDQVHGVGRHLLVGDALRKRAGRDAWHTRSDLATRIERKLPVIRHCRCGGGQDGERERGRGGGDEKLILHATSVARRRAAGVRRYAPQ